jgi:hypothetical protein
MVTVKRSVVMPLVAVVLGLVLLYVWLRPAGPQPVQAPSAPTASDRRGGVTARAGALPAIGLDRASSPREASGAGRRNVFDFYEPPPPPVARLPDAQVVYAPAPTPTPIPPLNMKYVGSAERSGVRKAIFLTDQNEVLTGAEGETVANRVKVVRINLESIDVQDLWSGQPRRIPLKGN